jgi:long-chain acyl-CoA synthetase
VSNHQLSLTDSDVFRIVRDIFVEELSRSRRDAFEKADAAAWSTGTEVRAGGLDLDSLERFTLAGRLYETFALYRSGVEDSLLRARTLGDTIEVILAGLRHFSEEIHFYSGGTVGTQRIVPHSAETLLEEIDERAGLFADRRRVIVTVPVHHIYGFLFGVLRPRALRVPVVDAQYRLLSREAQPVPGDLIVSIPFLWERYLPRVGSWGTDVVGSSSTAPLSADLGSELCRAGLSRLVEVYGSSETAGVGWRDHCAPRTGGASHSAPVRRSGTAVGEVETIGFALFERWTRGTDDVLRGTAGTVALPDRLEWRDDRHFLPRGRRDAVVQVGGNNVDLDALRLRILEVVPEAEDCALRLREDRLRLFVAVPAEQGDGPDSSPSPDAAPATPSSAITAAEIARRLRATLPDYAVPPAVTVGSTIPRTPTGKIADW